MAAAAHRNAIEGELQRFTLRVTRRTVPIMFSMMLVAGKRAPQLGRQTQPAHRQDLIQSLEDALRDAGGVALKALGEIADQLLRLRCVVEFPGLAQRTPDRGMQSRR